MERLNLMLIHTGDPPVDDADGPVAQRSHPASDRTLTDILPDGGGSFWRGLAIASALAIPLWALLIFGIYQLL